MLKDTFNHGKPSSSRGLRPLDPGGGLRGPKPLGEEQVTKLPAISVFLPSMKKFSKNPGDDVIIDTLKQKY